VKTRDAISRVGGAEGESALPKVLIW